MQEPSVPSRSHGDALSAPQGSTPGGSTPGSTPPPTGWDGAVLKQVEDHLARTVGPVAKVMVKRAAQRTTDLDRLYTLIADALPSAEERAAFLASRPKRTGTQPPQGTLSATRTSMTRAGTKLGGTRTTHGTLQITPEVVDEAARFLTPYLGPIAKIVAKRTAGATQDRQEFYQLLAAELASEQDRASFLRAVGAAF